MDAYVGKGPIHEEERRSRVEMGGYRVEDELWQMEDMFNGNGQESTSDLRNKEPFAPLTMRLKLPKFKPENLRRAVMIRIS